MNFDQGRKRLPAHSTFLDCKRAGQEPLECFAIKAGMRTHTDTQREWARSCSVSQTMTTILTSWRLSPRHQYWIKPLLAHRFFAAPEALIIWKVCALSVLGHGKSSINRELEQVEFL